MPSNSIPTYSTISDPYDNYLKRDSGQTDQLLAPNQSWGATNVPVGDTLTDLWISTWIKSRSYQPGVQGFMLDAQKGSVEANLGLFKDVHVNMAYQSGGITQDAPGEEFNVNAFVSTDGTGTGIPRVKINQGGIVLRNKTISTFFPSGYIGTTSISFEDFAKDGHYAQIYLTDNTGAQPSSFSPSIVHPEDILVVDLTNSSVDPDDILGNRFVIQSDSSFGAGHTDRLLTVSNRQLFSARRHFFTDSLIATVPSDGKIYFGYPTFPSAYAVEVINYLPGKIYFGTQLDLYRYGTSLVNTIRLGTNMSFLTSNGGIYWNSGGSSLTYDTGGYNTMYFNTPLTVAGLTIVSGGLTLNSGSITVVSGTISASGSVSGSSIAATSGSVTATGDVHASGNLIADGTIVKVNGAYFQPYTLNYKNWSGTNSTLYVLGHT